MPAIAQPVPFSPALAAIPAGESPHIPPHSPLSLRGILKTNFGPISWTYVLFNLENLLKLAQPLALGMAINGLLAGTYAGLGWFVVQHIAYVIVSRGRQRYDTRLYTRIYAELATNIVSEQRAKGVGTSSLAARSMLVRNFIDFFELYGPLVVGALYATVGALLMLAWYDPLLAPLCLSLLLPAWLLNSAYGRRTLRLNRGLHDELEHEVDVLATRPLPEVRRHYDALAGWRIRLSDAEATNFCLMELFVLTVLATSLVRFCMHGEGVSAAGDIFAVFRYVLMFVMGLDSIPRVVAQTSRLRDTARRLANG